MSQPASAEWHDLFEKHDSSELLKSYDSLDLLDNIPALAFLKDLVWREIRAWVQNDTSTMSLITHKDLEGPGHIFVGGMNHALNDDLLRENDIRAVISMHPLDLLAWDVRDPSYGLQRYGSDGCPVKHHLMIPLEDKSTSDFANHFAVTYKFLQEHSSQGTNVLIHCKSGRSRSVAVLIAYMQRVYFKKQISGIGVKYQQALQMMRAYREDITEVIRQQRLPVIIIMDRFLPLLELYELELIQGLNKVLSTPEKLPQIPTAGSEGSKAVTRAGAAVLKISVAIVFFKHNQAPLKSVVERLFEVNEAYYYELEGADYKGISYAESLHAHRGIVEFYAHFAMEHDIPIPHHISILASRAEQKPRSNTVV